MSRSIPEAERAIEALERRAAAILDEAGYYHPRSPARKEMEATAQACKDEARRMAAQLEGERIAQAQREARSKKEKSGEVPGANHQREDQDDDDDGE